MLEVECISSSIAFAASNYNMLEEAKTNCVMRPVLVSVYRYRLVISVVIEHIITHGSRLYPQLEEILLNEIIHIEL